MVLARQLPVGLGDLLRRGVVGDAEDLVVVLLEPLALRGHAGLPRRTCVGPVSALTIAGAQDAALPGVAAAQHLGDDGLAAVAGLVRDGLGDLGIERLAVEVDALRALLLQLGEQAR